MPDITISQITFSLFKPPVSRITLNQGDSADLTFSFSQDISLWDIRAEIYDNQPDQSGEIHSVSYASAGVSGGSDSEISVDASAQEFTIHIAAGDTDDFHGDIKLEIEINTNASGNNQVFTIYNDFIEFIPTRIS